MTWCEMGSLDPPHRVTHPERVDLLSLSLSVSGWRGPSLVGYPLDGRVQLLSGTHRLAAARHLGWLGVPVRILTREAVERAWGTDAWRDVMREDG